jgi:excisionase family DNA binding protein
MNAHAQLEHALKTPTVGGVVSEASGPYLLVEEVARRLRCSTRTIHELTRTNAIPHRRLAGSRRCLFRVDELEAWENGSLLQVRDLPRGGRVVTPSRSEDGERDAYTTNLPLSRRAASFSALRDQAP